MQEEADDLIPNQDAIELGYSDCLDSESLQQWTSNEASLADLYRFLGSLNNLQSTFLIDDLEVLQEVLLDEDSPHAQFVEEAEIQERLDNVEDFLSPSSVKRIRVDLLLPEFDDMVDIVREAVAGSPESPWEKAHVSLISQWPRPIGPCELDAVTYASRHGGDEVSTEDVRDILYGWCTRRILRDDGDEELDERIASGEISVGQIQSIWERRDYEPYYVWTPTDGEELVYEGSVLRLAAEFNVPEFEYWIDSARDNFREGPLGDMDPVRGTLWMFWVLFGSHRLTAGVSESTLQAWGWTLENCGIPDKAPWVCRPTIDDNGDMLYRKSVLVSSSIAYTSAVAPSLNISTETADEATRFLLKAQNQKGGWPDHLEGRFSILASAMAAWALHERGGYSDRVDRALRRLQEMALDTGGWSEENYHSRFPFATLTMAILELYHSFSTTPPSPMSTPEDVPHEHRFEVAFTFPGEARSTVRSVAEHVAERLGGREKVFYDNFHEAELARPDLDAYLQDIYREQSKLIVPFFSMDYEKKEWCMLEWRAVRDLIKTRSQERIMPFKLGNFDDIQGVFSIDGYVSSGSHTEEEMATLIIERLGSLEE